MQVDVRTALLWFPMRVTYGREETVKKALDHDGVDNFLPMREEWIYDDNHIPHRCLKPAIRNLIFIHSSQEQITQLKMYGREYQSLRYMSNVFSESDKILTVPDRQMDNFIRVASVQDDRVRFLEYNHEFLAKPGKRVRVIDGDFKGSEGTIRRIKKNQCVVVQVEGVAAVAITFVPSAWLEEI
jgi:hypothetical protein